MYGSACKFGIQTALKHTMTWHGSLAKYTGVYHAFGMVNNDEIYLGKLQDYYAQHRGIPSYAGIGSLIGVSKRAAVKFVDRMKAAGCLNKSPDGRVTPTTTFFSRPYVGNAPAGFASPAAELMGDAITIDEYLVEHPSSTVLVQVQGDSMIGAGIHNGDFLVVERRSTAREGDIVVAVVDGDFTIKYLQRDKQGYYLQPANQAFPMIRPYAALDIYGVMVGLFRKT